MNETILNKYYNGIERKIVVIFYMNKNEAFTSREIYAKFSGNFSFAYVSVSVVNLETLGILKKTSGDDKRNIQYQFSEEYEELGKRMLEEEAMDLDRNIPESERGKAILILNTIAKLSKDKKNITVDELRDELEKQGIEFDYKIKSIITNLNTQGMIYFPTPEKIQKVETKL